MLMKDNKKKMLSMIVQRAKGPTDIDNLKPVESENGVEQDYSVPAEAAAEDLLSALSSKNPKAIVEAFKALSELCESESEEPESED